MRLIDADKLISELSKWFTTDRGGELELKDIVFNEAIADTILEIEKAPTVDAIPVDWLKKYVLIEGAYMSEAKRKEREIAKKLLREYHESQHLEIR